MPEPVSEPAKTIRVVLITRDALYQGSVPGETSSGQPVRFLDVLRSPSRIAPGNVGGEPGLRLTEVTRQARGRKSEPMSFPEPVVLRPDLIVVAYDLGGSRSAPRTEYEQRGGERQRARVFLRGNLGVECTLAGGRRVLEGIRSATFLAATEVEIILGPRQRLPFLALNTRHIESVSMLRD